VKAVKTLVPVVLLAGVAALGLSACGDDSSKLPDGVVAQVGDAEISRASLDETLAQNQASAEASGQSFPQAGTSEYTQAEQQALEGLVLEQVVGFEARKCGPPCAVTDKDVTTALNEIIDTNFGGSQEQFDDFLEQQDLTRPEARELVKFQEQQEQLFNQVTRGVRFTRAQAREYYDANPDQFKVPAGREASHILVATKAEADEIRAQVTGDNFAELARENSTDEGSAEQGGSLGQIQRGQLVPEFEEVAFSLEDGEISQPVKTQFGWHIITVDLTPASTTTFAEAVDGILSSQLDQERQEAWTEWRDGVLEEWGDRTVYANSDLEPPEPEEAVPATPADPGATDGSGDGG
jgi:foldase protein PrsA